MSGGRPARSPDVHAQVRRAFTSATSGELFMNRTVLAMLAVIALSGCTTQDSAMTTTPPAFSADDESAVRALVNEFANTWNRHDMKAMHELDTEDVEWINVVGHHWRGKATVYKGHDCDSQGHVCEDQHERRIRDNPIDRAHRGGGRCDHALRSVPRPPLLVGGCGEDKRFIYDGQARWHLEDCALPEHGDRP